MKLLFSLLIFLTFTSCSFKSSEDYHREAQKLETQKKYKEAILILDKAVEKDSKNINALLDRGVDKALIQDYKGAINDYSMVIELDRDNGLAFLNRGKNKTRIKDYWGAINDFNNAISTKGGEMIYINKVENAFIPTGFEYDVKMEEIRFERGIARYNAAFLKSPFDKLKNVNYLKDAFSDFNFCIEKKFMLPDSYYWRALIYLSYGMNEKGCTDLKKAKDLGNSDSQDLIDKDCK